MPHGTKEKFGILPSLELLPFFTSEFEKAADLAFVTRASYGSIAREMLVGNLAGGILPWEIFAAEILALSGQRDQWKAGFFSDPSPTELVLGTEAYKALCPESPASNRKIPTRLQIGIENRSSFTRHQFTEWLNSLKLSPRPEVVFKFLPMDQRLQGISASALDGFIARSPWGIIAEEQELGTMVRGFSELGVSKKLIAVFHKNVDSLKILSAPQTLQALAKARLQLLKTGEIELAAQRMMACGKLHLPTSSILKAAELYRNQKMPTDAHADIARITEELQNLHKVSMLPPQIAATEQTARLLACS